MKQGANSKRIVWEDIVSELSKADFDKSYFINLVDGSYQWVIPVGDKYIILPVNPSCPVAVCNKADYLKGLEGELNKHSAETKRIKSILDREVI